jgi:hypothetical protein
MSDEPSELHYQQPPHRRRKIIRRTLLVLFILFGVAISLPLMKREFARMQLVKLFDACCAIKPHDIAHAHQQGAAKADVPPEWKDLNAALSANINSSGTLFLGRLRTLNGSESCLVGVDLVSWSTSPMILNMRVRTIVTDGRPRRPRYGLLSDAAVMLANSNNLVLHGGVIDPADPTHFSIAFESDSEQGFIDGWLKDDQTVLLQARLRSPTTAPALPSPGRSH